jgi:hypothetical protein
MNVVEGSQTDSLFDGYDLLLIHGGKGVLKTMAYSLFFLSVLHIWDDHCYIIRFHILIRKIIVK